MRLDESGTRRSFLIGAFLALASGLPTVKLLGLQRAEPRRWLRHLVPRMAAAAEIGRRYLHGRAAEASSSWLAERLFGDDLPDSPGFGDLAALRHRLSELRLADFQSGDLVFVDGWALTRTEARLMALVAVCAAR